MTLRGTSTARARRAPSFTVRDHRTLLFGRNEIFSGGDDDLFDLLEALVASHESHLVVTPNVDQVLLAERDGRSRAAIDRASVLLADGAPLVALARVLGGRRVARHTGADLLPGIAGRAALRGWTIAVTGGAQGVSDQAVEVLRAANPGSTIVSVPFPQRGESSEDGDLDVIDRIAASDAQIVFVCLGFPMQEDWYRTWADVLPPAVYIGAGAAVDFAAGAKSRAPRVVQAVGAEWVWRLLQEPRRLVRRYLVRGPLFVLVIAGAVLARANGVRVAWRRAVAPQRSRGSA